MYQVLRKLPNGAEKILKFMGYKATSPEMQELKYDGDVNLEQVLETAADLVILHSELDLIKELVGNAIRTSPHPNQVTNFLTLWNILDVRGRTDERYNDTWQRLMKEAYQSQREANLHLYLPHGSSGEPSSDITCGGRVNPPVTDARRGSAPLLDQASVVRGGIVPVTSGQSHLQFPAPAEQWPRSMTRPPPSTNWDQTHPQLAPHQHYAASGSSAQPFLQSRDPPTTVCKHGHLDAAAKHHQDLHRQYQDTPQTGLAGSQIQHNKPPLSDGHPHHYHNMDHNMQTTSSRSGSEKMATGRCGSEHMVTGRHGSEQTTTGGCGSQQTTTGRCGSQQMTTGGRGTELMQNTGRKSDGVYANISETILKSDQGISTSQSSAAKDEHDQSQPAEPVWIPNKSPQLHSSEKSYSFQEKLQNLFQQFPGLVKGQEASSPPTLMEGQETAKAPDPNYQNISNLLQSDVVVAKQSQESLAPNTSEFPEPVVQSEAELEQLARHRQNSSGLMSIINPDIKDARSVRDESGFAPCYESLISPDRSPAATPCTQVQREVDEAWKVHTSVKSLDSGSSTDDKKSPIPSLGTTSLDDAKLQSQDGQPSPSSSGTEDIYNSSAGQSLESPKHKPGEESGVAAVEQETLTTAQTNPRVVADSGDTSPSPEPLRRPLRRPLSHQSAVSESDSKGPPLSPKEKPTPKPRLKKQLEDMHKVSKSLDNELDEPNPPQPTPRGMVRTVKSASDLQQLRGRPLSGSQFLDVPSTQPEVPLEDEEHNMTPGESQVGSHDVQTNRQNVKIKPKVVPRRGASMEAKNILSDDATTTRESVTAQERTMAVGKESELPIEPPTSPLHVKTLASVRPSNVMACEPEQVLVKEKVTNESNLDFGGQRAQQKLNFNQRQGSSVAANIPSPSELVVGQTDIPDPVVHGFWFCSYCTNLVSNSAHVCDVCGTDQETV